MTQSQFAPGQRWVSNTEPDLGLGLVERFETRRVHIFYPAAQDVRTYATDNAPLSRVIYAIGDGVRNEGGAALTVSELHEDDGCILYVGEDEDGNTVQLPEQELNSFVRFSRPQDRLFTGQIDGNSRYLLRMDTRELNARHQGSPAFGLLGPRVQLLPHQLYIADELSKRHAPRVLLADEVGLGKTIESGLVVHQRLLAGTANRVLVVVPESLVHQWLVEMLRRFNLSFTVLDEERCEELVASGEANPFESAQLVIVPLPMLVESPSRLEQALAATWDIVVVDEAHHLRWTDAGASPEHAAVEALGQVSEGLLLLTATPEQLGVAAHFARLRLLDPAKYTSLEAFQENESSYGPLATLVDRLLDAQTSGTLDDPTREELKDYLSVEELDALSSDTEATFAQGVQRALDSMLDRHGIGRVVLRNTRATVGGFPTRELHTYPLPAPEQYGRTLEAGVTVPDAPHDDTSVADPLFPETVLGADWVSIDPRVAWVSDFLAANGDDKTLVICAHAASAIALEEHLRTRGGVRTAVFHEHLSLVARDRAAAYFVEEDDDAAQVLVASEIGSEGRNFQCARHLVLFDLPRDPDLLEQRIGRLDRIGQRDTVRIHVPYISPSPQAVLVRWYDEGLGAFRAPCPGANTVVAQLGDRLQASLSNYDDEAAISQLVIDANKIMEEVTAVLREGRERLLEANSFRRARADEVVRAVSDATHELELIDFMERVFDQFGVEQERHSAGSIVLRPSEHMTFDSFPGLPEDGATVTFNRPQALAREDMHFLTWEHPMVTGAIDLILNGGVGNTTVSTLKLPSVKAGLLLVEGLFVLDCPGPRQLQLSRYLPPTAHRVLVDVNGADLSGALSAKQLGQLARRVPLGTAQQIVKETRADVAKLIATAQKLAAPIQAPLLEEARARACDVLDPELARLRALSEINPDLGDEEVAHFERLRDDTLEHLARGELALDAIRLAVTV
jgi:ATP-dependent helicase HepA